MIVLLPAELRERTVKATRAAASDPQTPREVRRLLSNGLYLLIDRKPGRPAPAAPAATPASEAP
ncbi:MAG: hypothetical protein HQL40_18095, partial [Alphaproteobacteria bacterium]|nr:hypothetical protein [Alphaproteobacteria bacterium]